MTSPARSAQKRKHARRNSQARGTSPDKASASSAGSSRGKRTTGAAQPAISSDVPSGSRGKRRRPAVEGEPVAALVVSRKRCAFFFFYGGLVIAVRVENLHVTILLGLACISTGPLIRNCNFV